MWTSFFRVTFAGNFWHFWQYHCQGQEGNYWEHTLLDTVWYMLGACSSSGSTTIPLIWNHWIVLLLDFLIEWLWLGQVYGCVRESWALVSLWPLAAFTSHLKPDELWPHFLWPSSYRIFCPPRFIVCTYLSLLPEQALPLLLNSFHSAATTIHF